MKLNLYTVFHLNLGFSCIPSEQYPLVIKRCYWPLLRWAEAGIAKFGIEIPAETLRIIDSLDPHWVSTFRELHLQKKVELVGSGLVQAIFPLIPAEVNRWNLKLGQSYYEKKLGIIPTISYLHEQSYSKGNLPLYRDAGIDCIVFDWHNAKRYTDRNPELQNKVPYVLGAEDAKLRILWNNSVAFQYVQKYLYGDLNLDEYMSYLESQSTGSESQIFCFYGSDFEVLDYKPGSAEGLYSPQAQTKDHDKFEQLLQSIQASGKFTWKLPSEIVHDHSIDETVILESAENPIPTKKQKTYNVTRWALGGRSNPKLNTLCFRAYKLLKEVENSLIPNEERTEYWRRLCLAWASDFRTHTTESKYLESIVCIGGLLHDLEELASKLPRKSQPKAVPSQISIEVKESQNHIRLTSPYATLSLNTKKGTIRDLIFPDLQKGSLLGTLAQGTFQNISYGVDYYSGHTIIERPGAFRYLDRDDTKLVHHGMSKESGNYEVVFKHHFPNFTLWKTYSLPPEKAEVGITYHFHFKDLVTSRIRFGVLTMVPSSFNHDKLWYATKNGGDSFETFDLKGAPAFDAGDTIGFAVSSSFCLGATSGEFLFGDDKTALVVRSEPSEQYSVPMVSYTPFDKNYLFRVFYSMGEWDDTANTLWRGHTTSRLSIAPAKPLAT